MTDTTFVDACEIFEKVKREEAAKRQAESDGSWPVMDAAAFYGLAGGVVRIIAPDSESELSFAPHGDDCVSMSLGTSGHWR